jgi:hypothetical protein
MKNLKFIGLILAVTFSVANTFAQKSEDNPNLNGTWVLEAKKSAVNSLLKSHSSDKAKLQCVTKLIISHNAPEIMIDEITECKMPNKPDVKPVVNETKSIHFTDERGEKNREVESRTKWKGKRILITFYRIDKNGKKTESIIQEISLSKDEKTLTIKSDTSSDFGTPNPVDMLNFSRKTLVYTRVN